jgi:hypothetical protein
MMWIVRSLLMTPILIVLLLLNLSLRTGGRWSPSVI